MKQYLYKPRYRGYLPPIFLNGIEVIWNKRTLPSSVQKIPFLKFLNARGKEKINFKTPPAPLREQESRDKMSSYIARQFFRFLRGVMGRQNWREVTWLKILIIGKIKGVYPATRRTIWECREGDLAQNRSVFRTLLSIYSQMLNCSILYMLSVKKLFLSTCF